ncbi:MAG TPA: hypothetical protein VFJ63_04410 [Candidatus Bathyarchaeia archaeon]|nr:hypothetical protein [Candidatus Bathyarchaeia archaeon]
MGKNGDWLEDVALGKTSKYRVGKSTGTHAGSVQFEKLRKEKRRATRSKR